MQSAYSTAPTDRATDLGVVTPLVTAETERAFFFCREGSFFAHAPLHFLSGLLGVSAFFVFIFNLILWELIKIN